VARGTFLQTQTAAHSAGLPLPLLFLSLAPLPFSVLDLLAWALPVAVKRLDLIRPEKNQLRLVFLVLNLCISNSK
jgi:hypothetical protein